MDNDALAVEALRALVRIPTVSWLDADPDTAVFERFRDALAELHPAAWAALDIELIADSTILARWRGTSANAPRVLMAHQDVVAAPEDGWTHPPFAAELHDGVVWGRGTLDDKGSLAAIWQAINDLVTAGFTPERDIYLIHGHDEETRGTGAAAAVDALVARGVQPEWVLDEGGAVIEPPLPGLTRDVAVIGVAEKGTNTLRLSVHEAGGHASTPPRRGATWRLARAVQRVSEARFPRTMGPVTKRMLVSLGDYVPGALGAALRRIDTLHRIVTPVLERSDETRAMIATTATVTMLKAADAPNAIAEHASAIVNVRIAPESSVHAEVARIRRIVRDRHVTVEVLERNEPSRTSPMEGAGWDDLVRQIRAHFPDALPAPYVMLGASDARHAQRVWERVYRFMPFALTRAERLTLHARDERIPVATFLKARDFYRTLLETL